jgi:hypothetical protein
MQLCTCSISMTTMAAASDLSSPIRSLVRMISRRLPAAVVADIVTESAALRGETFPSSIFRGGKPSAVKLPPGIRALPLLAAHRSSNGIN